MRDSWPEETCIVGHCGGKTQPVLERKQTIRLYFEGGIL